VIPTLLETELLLAQEMRKATIGTGLFGIRKLVFIPTKAEKPAKYVQPSALLL
jgi:hypothetical protein